jgi:type IV pilus assembly protein PilC
MAEFVLKYADARGQIKQEIAQAATEQEVREKFTQQGFLVYSVKPKGKFDQLVDGCKPQEKAQRKVPDLQPAVRHADPRRSADPEVARPAGRPAHRPQTGPHIKAVRDEVRNGTLLSTRSPQGIFPPIYVTSVMAGREERRPGRSARPLHHYQRLALAVRKKILLR